MKRAFAILLILLIRNLSAQETLPIYADYLSDNVYLLHPAAGIGECTKIRLTARKQWFGVDDAPSLQTISYHSKANGDSNTGYGIILFNDNNGYHSQKGIQGTYAYHLNMGNDNLFNQLSFGLSLSFVQNEVDQTSFFNDPRISQIIQSDFYYNADFGVAYHYKGFASYFTVKNLFLATKGNLNSNFESLNLRNYIFNTSYFFGEERTLQYEPSVMFQYKAATNEKIFDVNFKVYKTIRNKQFWAALSYRTTLDNNIFGEAQYITPIVGINLNKFMVAYTYTKQFGDIVFANGGFHQISLGYNFDCAKRRASACPNINGRLF